MCGFGWRNLLRAASDYPRDARRPNVSATSTILSVKHLSLVRGSAKLQHAKSSTNDPAHGIRGLCQRVLSRLLQSSDVGMEYVLRHDGSPVVKTSSHTVHRLSRQRHLGAGPQQAGVQKTLTRESIGEESPRHFSLIGGLSIGVSSFVFALLWYVMIPLHSCCQSSRSVTHSLLPAASLRFLKHSVPLEPCFGSSSVLHISCRCASFLRACWCA